MSKWRVLLPAMVLACLLAGVNGCGGEEPAEKQGVVDAIHEALDRYTAGSMHDPIDTPENEARIVGLLSKLVPLEGEAEIDAVLNVFLSYDATDNAASTRAREMLVDCGAAALPLVRARLATSQTPDEINALIADIEAD